MSPWHRQQLVEEVSRKMEEWPAWPLNQWLLPGLLKRGIRDKCKWGKSIDGETSFFSPAARPQRKGLRSRLRCVWTENLGHSARRRVNMWHRSPATCENDLAVCPPAGFQTSIQPHAAAPTDRGRPERVHCRHLTVGAAKEASVFNWSFSRIFRL